MLLNILLLTILVMNMQNKLYTINFLTAPQQICDKFPDSDWGTQNLWIS